ncbi:MAG TPA: hypothetical protein VFQ23_05470 [Anaerolineales bacterium]|nr:hypothetical protein [Anaerolineales bacterium]
MKLIDRYVAQVGKNLPAKTREDIEKELKSTLEDMLEDRAQKLDRPADEAMELELLREYGAPDKVADTYYSMQYLIGPRMYPTFIMVLKIVFTVLSALAVVGLVVALGKVGFAGREFAQTLMQTVGGYIGAAITAFGNVVLVFVLLERFLPDSELKELKIAEEWDPTTLLKEQNPDIVKRGELIAEIIFTFAAVVILNFYPQIIGISFPVDGEWFTIPMFSDAFFRFLPWINLTLLAEIILDIYLLRQNIWSRSTRLVKVIVEASNAAITIAILNTPGILGFTAESFAGSPINAETAKTLTTVFTTMFPIVLSIVLIIQAFELAKAIYQLVKSRPS